jgi:hypothetical protein
MSKSVVVGEQHEPHCALAWTCDGLCSCSPPFPLPPATHPEQEDGSEKK